MKYFSQREVRPRYDDSLAAERCRLPAVGTNRGEIFSSAQIFSLSGIFQERVESLLEAFRPGRERERDKVRSRNILNIFLLTFQIFFRPSSCLPQDRLNCPARQRTPPNRHRRLSARFQPEISSPSWKYFYLCLSAS